jgi:hypothetical protein
MAEDSQSAGENLSLVKLRHEYKRDLGISWSEEGERIGYWGGGYIYE